MCSSAAYLIPTGISLRKLDTYVSKEVGTHLHASRKLLLVLNLDEWKVDYISTGANYHNLNQTKEKSPRRLRQSHIGKRFQSTFSVVILLIVSNSAM